jgi:hypothetical protein
MFVTKKIIIINENISCFMQQLEVDPLEKKKKKLSNIMPVDHLIIVDNDQLVLKTIYHPLGRNSQNLKKY